GREGLAGTTGRNGGGRQRDGEPGTLELLPAAVEAAGDLPVLLDSGARSGADIAKALALGAYAVLVGRPYAYGLALAGETGAREVIRNMIAAFDLTLALGGLTGAAELSPDCLPDAWSAPAHPARPKR